jgi:hypothetical protein
MFFVLGEFLLDFSDKEAPVTDYEEFHKVDEHSEHDDREKEQAYRVSAVIFLHEVSEAQEEVEVGRDHELIEKQHVIVKLGEHRLAAKYHELEKR